MQVKRNRATVCALPSSHLPLTREARTWCGARGGCDFATVVVMAVLCATGGASSSPTKSGRDSADTKPYKHTQTLTLRKARGIVLGDIFHLTGGCRVQVFCILCRIYDRLRRYNNRSCQKVEIAKQMSYDIIIKL